MQLEDNTNHFNIYQYIMHTYVSCISDSLLYFVSESSSTCVIYILHRDVVSCSICNSASRSVHLYKQYAVCITFITTIELRISRTLISRMQWICRSDL